MNKGLEALKEARKFRDEKDKNFVLIDIDYFNRCLDGIETELNEKANIEKSIAEIFTGEKGEVITSTEIIKKLKALEIIKELLNLKVIELLPNDSDTRLFVNFGNLKASVLIPPKYIDLLKEVFK